MTGWAMRSRRWTRRPPAAILARRGTVEAYAVSGYFGVRNPDHERRVRGLVEELTGKPVTCGHELTNQSNAVRRATTVALNAHLILPLRQLMTDVQDTLVSLDIAAPLMVVRGDGSLVHGGVGDAAADRDNPFGASRQRSGRLASRPAERRSARPAGHLDGGCRRHHHRHRGAARWVADS